jgi:hypothetical protein
LAAPYLGPASEKLTFLKIADNGRMDVQNYKKKHYCTWKGAEIHGVTLLPKHDIYTTEISLLISY